MRRALIPGVVMILLTAGGMPFAQGEPTGPRVWTERWDYQVEIDGVVSSDARLFTTQGRPAMLLAAPELDVPLVLQLDSRQVMLADGAALAQGPGPEEVSLDDAAIHGPPEPYVVNDDVVVLYHQGHRVAIARKPPIVGDTTLPEILAHTPIYKQGMAAYTPSSEDVAFLHSFPLPVRIQVFFGTWCPACKQTVPRFLKSMELADNPGIQMTFTGVPTPPFGDYPPAKENGIHGVPTFIVYAGDKEVGRVSVIPGNSSVEHELVKILTDYQHKRG